jgi:Na+/H+-dicarboxylate symporter
LTVALEAKESAWHLDGPDRPPMTIEAFSEPGQPPLMFMGFILTVLLVFAILVGAALLLRRRRDYHRRLMLLSCLSMVGPGLFRIPLKHVPIVAFLRTGGPFGLFGLDLLLVYACIGYDTWRHRRLHPAFVFGALLIALEDLPFLGIFLSSPTWTHVATWFVS